MLDINHSSQPAPTPRFGLRSLEKLTPFLALTGTLLFGISSTTAQEYARGLGLTMEDAGFGNLRSALFASLLGLFAAVILLVTLSAMFSHQVTTLVISKKDDAGALRWWGIALVTLAALVLIWLPTGASSVLIISATLTGAGIGAFTGLVLPSAGSPGGLRRWVIPVVRSLALLSAFALLVFSSVRTIEAGSSLANHLRQTGLLQTGNFWNEFVVVGLGIEVIPVDERRHADRSLGCAVAVARSDGEAWILDSTSEEVRPWPTQWALADLRPIASNDLADCWRPIVRPPIAGSAAGRRARSRR